MSAPDSSCPFNRPQRIRRDGWTPERQLRFLETLARTRSVTRAAASAGMSRESAYRLRARRDGALFAAIWDGIVQPGAGGNGESHIPTLSDCRLARLLGTCFRRKHGDFSSIGSTIAERQPA